MNSWIEFGTKRASARVMKRALDIVVSFVALIFFSPILGIAALAISIQDGHSPFFIGARVGKDGKLIRFIKLRSMKIGSDATGVDTTVADDPRITRVGHFIRRTKIDELPELWHVLIGEMSLVGPRPNLEREVQLYTDVERQLLSITPGITDISSIVFSNLGEILSGAGDPNVAYGQLVRPWKSRLGLWYLHNRSFGIDIAILALTFVSLFSRTCARWGSALLLQRFGATEELRKLPFSTSDLTPMPPPGSKKIFTGDEREAALRTVSKSGASGE